MMVSKSGSTTKVIIWFPFHMRDVMVGVIDRYMKVKEKHANGEKVDSNDFSFSKCMSYLHKMKHLPLNKEWMLQNSSKLPKIDRCILLGMLNTRSQLSCCSEVNFKSYLR
jgi:hypothetical protein